ncbi:MAG: hypothetical protein LBH34_05125, partial [Prevotellaceae bacterium]|nr:hypothetical protein [Prevotellaceae bacterium]
NDYFDSDAVIDSVKVGGYEHRLDKDSRLLYITPVAKSNNPLLAEIKVWSKGYAYSLVARYVSEIPVEIKIPDKGYNVVHVKGEFNGWNIDAGVMQKKEGYWVTTVNAKPGKYQYCLVVDGKETLDSTNSTRVSNNMGGFNSLLSVGNTDGDSPELITQGSNGRIVTFTVQNGYDDLLVLWNNFRLSTGFVKDKVNTIDVSIPSNVKRVKRSFLRIYAYNKHGVGNDILIPLEYGKPVEKWQELERTDMQTQILYSLMVDRFNDGNPGNTKKLNDPKVHYKADYYGGDLAGVTQKIKDGFFDRLGVNSIWISPITQNPYDAWGQHPSPRTKFSGYHGYWPLYITKVDTRFGTDDDLRELISEAHKHNINVILDYVANHVHINNPIIKEHPNWATPLRLPDGTLNLEKWDTHRLTTWFDKHLPTLDLSRPEVADPMSDSALYWLENFDLDGFRHDATKHVDELYWRMLTKKIKRQIDRSVYQIGETYGSPELINSYVSSGMLNGQFDFNVYDAAVSAFAGDGSMMDLKNVLQQSLDTYGYHNLMGYITGNHDRVRFISYAGGEVSFSEDGKNAGWKRKIGVGNPVAYKKLGLLHSFIFSISGVPCIYYGDEFGMPGANDPDNRRMMKFDNYNSQELILQNNVERLIQLRRQNLPLTYGDTEFLYVDDNILCIARTYLGEITVSIVNKNDVHQNIQIPLPLGYQKASFVNNFGGNLTNIGGEIQGRIDGLSFEILTGTK